ncbi:CsbD family protein [Kiloniella litopenaei]|uniref:CsbD family protein n=1 Tax=Kiloniella litopenaei TaxID=1549748 RepID=UPI003BAAC672
MNSDIIKGKWNQLKGTVQKEWGELTNDEVDQINGDATKLAGLIQERYGKSREESEREVDEWQKRTGA